MNSDFYSLCEIECSETRRARWILCLILIPKFLRSLMRLNTMRR